MNNIVLHNQTNSTYTQVSNVFIDEYMPSANGSYVKVYLLILRMLSDNQISLSVSGIADILELTENDVIRAFSYWEKHRLITIKTNQDGDITDLTVNSFISEMPKGNFNVVLNPGYLNSDNTCKKDKPAGITASDTKTLDKHMRTYSLDEIAAITSKDEFSWIITIIEKYMEQTLSPTDVEIAVFLYDTLKFSPELIFHLYEYCISRGKKNSKYIQTVAINWANENVDSVEKANQYSARFENEYINVMKAFGLSQAPAPAQKQYIDTWLAYGFSADVIREACNRTIIAVNEPNFKYANGILEKWHKLGVKTMEDVRKSDEARNASYSTTPQSVTKNKPVKKNSFNSYEQRKYTPDDYKSLEQLLSR